MALSVKTSTKSAWSTLFPEDHISLKNSKYFVKKLLAVGFSTITYLRNLFPEDAYDDYDVEGMKLMILLDSSKYHSSNKLVTWIKNAFEAINMQYLRQLTFAVYGGPNSGNPIESYTFKIFYKEDGAFIEEFSTTVNDVEKKFDVKRSTQTMLRTLLLLSQSLKPLPSKVYLAMRIKYYDAQTPAEYEPVGFKPVSYGLHKNPNDQISMQVGEVSTFYHTVKLHFTINKASYWNSSENDEEGIVNMEKNVQLEFYKNEGKYHKDIENFQPCLDLVNGSTCANQSQDSLVAQGVESDIVISHFVCEDQTIEIMSDDETEDPLMPAIEHTSLKNCTSSLETKADAVPCLEPLENEKAQDVPKQNQAASVKSKGSLTRKEESAIYGDGELVRCECGVFEDDGLMILCDVCKTWQHALCFKVLLELVQEEHVCLECSLASNQPCTDPSLQEMSKAMVLKTCLLRRTLNFLKSYQEAVTLKKVCEFLGVANKQAQQVMKWLKTLSVFIPSANKRSHILDHKQVKSLWAYYFDKNPEDIEVEDTNSSQNLNHIPSGCSDDSSELYSQAKKKRRTRNTCL